jgi:hypothetical protein
MSAGLAYAASNLSAADVAGVIREIVRQGFVVVESLTDSRLDRLDLAHLELELQGRAFSAEAEVRWQRSAPLADDFTVLVLTEKTLTLEGDWQHTEFDSTHGSRQLLWGRWNGQGWTEARIPRPQQYPVEGSEKQPLAQLRTVEYRQNGVTRLTRLAGIEARADDGGGR